MFILGYDSWHITGRYTKKANLFSVAASNMLAVITVLANISS